MPETPAVDVDDVSFSYGEIPVLEKVSFTMEKGAFITMVGPNGGGKTTLLKLILGLIKPHSGSVRVFGKTPEKAREKMQTRCETAALSGTGGPLTGHFWIIL